MQVKCRFCFLAEAFDLIEFIGFGFVERYARGRGGEELAEDGFAAEFAEAGEEDGGLRRSNGRCVLVSLLGCHGL